MNQVLGDNTSLKHQRHAKRVTAKYQLTILMFILNYSVRCFFVVILLSIIGCKKDDQNNNSTSNGNSDSTKQVKIEGTIYWSSGDNKIRSLNLKTNKYIESPVLQFTAGDYYTPLAYDSGLVYTAGRYGTSCVDASTGAIVWERRVANSAYNGTIPSTRNSVVVSGNLAYAVGYTGLNGNYTLYAMDKRSGIVKWQKETTGEADFSTLTTPVINGDQIIIPGNDKFIFGTDLNRMICLNKNNGNVIWDKVYNASFGSNFSVKNNVLYAYTRDTIAVVAINTTDGTQKWKTQIPAGISNEKFIFADNELVVHAASWTTNTYPNYYYYLDYNSGLIKGSLNEIHTLFRSWIKTDLNYIANTETKLTAFDTKNHSVQWQVQEQDLLDQDTIPAATTYGVTELLHYNDYLLQFAVWLNPNLPIADKVVIKTIYVTDIKNGKTVQRIKLPMEIPVSYPLFGFILINQNKAYYTYNSGNI
jgi:outer membrane protein assembly factor BamB